MEETPIMVSQGSNELLLNAIKDKFATQNSRVTPSISLPKLGIPTLNSQNDCSVVKRPSSQSTHLENSAGLTSTTSGKTVSNLNQFLLEHLQENSLLTGNGLVVPTLQLSGTKLNATSIDLGSQPCIPALNSSWGKENSTNLSTLNKGLNNLSIDDPKNVPTTIDLTAALSTNITLRQKTNDSTKGVCVEFDIPFIECDRKIIDVKLHQTNVLSHTVASRLKMNHCLIPPSTFARIACLQYKCKRKLPYIDHSFKAKHKIHHFHFATKSPDDLIQEKFERYHR